LHEGVYEKDASIDPEALIDMALLLQGCKPGFMGQQVPDFRLLYLKSELQVTSPCLCRKSLETGNGNQSHL